MFTPKPPKQLPQTIGYWLWLLVVLALVFSPAWAPALVEWLVK